MQKPLVSVVVAAYETDSHFLRVVIESALQQTYSNLELLISDDSKSNAVKDIVDQYDDQRIKYIRNSPGLGTAANHFRTFAIARGEFIAILNHDDAWHSSFIETLLLPLLEDSECAISFCDHWIIDGAGKHLIEKTEQNSICWKRDRLSPGKHLPFDQLIVDMSIPLAMGSIIRKSSLPSEFDERSGPAYDLWLAISLALSGKAAFYVPERLSMWRIHPSSQTSSGSLAWSNGSIVCWQKVIDQPDFRQIHSIAKKRKRRLIMNSLRQRIKCGEFLDASKHLLRLLVSSVYAKA